MAKYRDGENEQKSAPVGWYGWKSLIGVVPVYGLYATAMITDEDWVFVPAVIGGILVTPVAHWTHGNKGRGWLSFGLNIGTQMIGAGLGKSSGALAAFGIWNAIDIVALHYAKPKPTMPAQQMPLGIQSFGVVPMIDRERKGFTLYGQF